MAILRNREVTYLGKVSGHDSSAPVRVEDAQGNIEIVKLSELRFTEDEIKDMQKYEENQLAGLAKIDNKELKELRDSQDPAKAEQVAKRQREEADQVNTAHTFQMTKPTQVHPVVKNQQKKM